MEVMLIILALFAAFYFMLVRPVLQQQRKQRREMADLQVGDEVLTTGGLLATVTAIDTPEEGPVRITLEIAPGVRVQAIPQAIMHRMPGPAVDEAASGDAPQPGPAEN